VEEMMGQVAAGVFVGSYIGFWLSLGLMVLFHTLKRPGRVGARLLNWVSAGFFVGWALPLMLLVITPRVEALLRGN
jgi:hypothetical protein